jgi:hypothetical protein
VGVYGTLIFEWSATEMTDRVAFTGIGALVDESPICRREVRVGWIAEARLAWPHHIHIAERG